MIRGEGGRGRERWRGKEREGEREMEAGRERGGRREVEGGRERWITHLRDLQPLSRK